MSFPLAARQRTLWRSIPAPARQIRAASQGSIAEAVRPLVYDLHEPSRPKTDNQRAPIILLHGLFGSKKNNRGISKYARTPAPGMGQSMRVLLVSNNGYRALARDLGRYVYALVSVPSHLGR